MTKSLLAQRSFCVSNSHKSKKNETTAKMGKRIKKKEKEKKKCMVWKRKSVAKGKHAVHPKAVDF